MTGLPPFSGLQRYMLNSWMFGCLVAAAAVAAAACSTGALFVTLLEMLPSKRALERSAVRPALSAPPRARRSILETTGASRPRARPRQGTEVGAEPRKRKLTEGARAACTDVRRGCRTRSKRRES